MTESKIDATHRLHESGQWYEASIFRDAERKRFREQGMTRAEAGTRLGRRCSRNTHRQKTKWTNCSTRHSNHHGAVETSISCRRDLLFVPSSPLARLSSTANSQPM